MCTVHWKGFILQRTTQVSPGGGAGHYLTLSAAWWSCPTGWNTSLNREYSDVLWTFYFFKHLNFNKVFKNMFFDAECTFTYTDGVVQQGETLHWAMSALCFYKYFIF